MFSLAERLARNTKQTDDGCWIWTGRTDRQGYGVLRRRSPYTGRKYNLAHRAAYELAHGAISNGLVVRHTCDNPPCVRPDHLVAGTLADNSADMVERERHPLYHPLALRRTALARALVGESVKAIAQDTGLPLTTVKGIVSRWRAQQRRRPKG